MLVPWQDTNCPHRHQALEHVMATWVAHGYPVRLCRLTKALPWCKAAALSLAMHNAPEVVIVADADCVVANEAVTDCVETVRGSHGWAIPHWEVHRLTRAATERYINGVDEPYHHERPPYVGVAAGGIVVLHRDAALGCPMDGTYRGWGGEDYSWGFALDTLVGHPHRPDVHYDLIHLWHPRDPRSETGTNLCSDEERRRTYFTAWAERDVDTMRRLVEGGRVWPST